MSINAVPSKSPISAPGLTQLGGIAPLISTKTRVPRLRPDLLLRPRLIDFIHTHLDRRLILISAPAGYGKTSLLTGFAADTDLKVCWYTLDPFDQDLHVFLEYLVEAIAVRFPEFGHRSRALLRDIAEPSGDLYPIVTTMVREIYDRIEEHFVLILDDHHTVETQEHINEFLDLFVTYVDENCHLILASRTLPALPNLSLHVARRQAAGLSIDELRFTAAEVRALAKQNYGLGLNLEQAEILAQRTGGWITGLLLTAVSQWEQEKADLPDQGWVNVDLYDYLSRQVLDQQPADLQSFLMGSSVLDELSPDLCTTVLGINGSVAFIDQMRISITCATTPCSGSSSGPACSARTRLVSGSSCAARLKHTPTWANGSGLSAVTRCSKSTNPSPTSSTEHSSTCMMRAAGAPSRAG
jgi:LuxR family maltose regulon positive regulatory protein